MTELQRRMMAGALSTLVLGAVAQPGSAAEPTTLVKAIVALTPTTQPPTTQSAETAADPSSPVAPPADDQIECVAKVIVHEAGNQPRDGQIAVAQVIRARMKTGGFGADACAVIRQRGQFFDVEAYNPSRDDARWDNAVAIATSTLAGEGDEVAPGALFFHAVSSPMANRVRVAQIADHVFYR